MPSSMDAKKFIVSLLWCLANYILIANGQQRSAVVITPADQHVARFEGESYFVSCKSTDKKQSDNEKQWQDPKNNRITSSEQSRIRTEASVSVGLELNLKLNRIRSEDAGVYACVSRSGRAGFNLTVVRPIVFDTSLAVQSAQEGQDFIMKCNARGHSGQPKIIWKIDFKSPQGRFKQQPDGSLYISGVTESDARSKFLCRAMDINSARPDTKEMQVVLKVQMKPKIQGPSRKDQYGVEGQWATLTCAVSAYPPARFEWQFENRGLLTNTNGYQIFNQTENVSILQLIIRKAQDFGDYSCKAINEMGSVTQTLSLKRSKKPCTPTLHVLHVGSTGAAVKVVNPEDPSRSNDPATDGDKRAEAEHLPVIGYSVQFKRTGKENWVTADDVTQTSYGFILRNLIPNVTYLIRATSKNQASQSDYSEDLQVTTPENVQFNPPLNNGVQNSEPLLHVLLSLIFIGIISSL